MQRIEAKRNNMQKNAKTMQQTLRRGNEGAVWQGGQHSKAYITYVLRVPYILRASIHKKVNIRSAKNIQKAKNKLKQNECKKTKNAQNATNCQEQRQYATQCNTTLRMASKCTVAKSNKMQESNGTQSTSITQLLAKIQQGTQ